MSAQTVYKFGTAFGAAGGIVDLVPHAIDTFLNEEETGVMKFGMAVVDGTNAGTGIVLPTSADDKFEGITVNNRTTEYDLDGNIRIVKGVAMGVMRYGKIYGRLAEGAEPSYGAPVYVVVEGNDKGCLSTSGGMAINARFVSGADNGVAMIELQQNNLVDNAGATYTLPAASGTTLGGVKVGTGLDVAEDGTISVHQG